LSERFREFLLQAAMLLLVVAIFAAGVLFGMTLVPPEIIVVERIAPSIQGFEILWRLA